MIWGYVDLHIMCKGTCLVIKSAVFHTWHVIFIKRFWDGEDYISYSMLCMHNAELCTDVAIFVYIDSSAMIWGYVDLHSPHCVQRHLFDD